MKTLLTTLVLLTAASQAAAHSGHTSLQTLCWNYNGSMHDQWESTNPNFSWGAPYHHTGDYTVAQVCAQWQMDDGVRLPGVEYYKGGLTSEPPITLIKDRVGSVLDECGKAASQSKAIARAEAKCPSTTFYTSGHREFYYKQRWTHSCDPHPLDPTGLSGMGLRVTTAWEVDCHYKYYHDQKKQ